MGQFSEKRLLVIGDVMLDRFIWGNVSRISPEAPVPVVHVTSESSYPGGAANVARNLSPFTARVDVMGLVGQGPQAEALIDTLKRENLETELLLQCPDHETIVKTRVIARSQQVVRIDRERAARPDAALIARAQSSIEARLNETDAIIFEDYAKGFICQELVDFIVEQASARHIPITVDPNPNNPISWSGATAIKPNKSEAFKLAGQTDRSLGKEPLKDPAIAEVERFLRDLWGNQHLLITLGEEGMVLFPSKGQPVFCPPRAREVFDVSGAGDTAIAFFTLALCSGAEPAEAALLANGAASAVVGKIGTATLTQEELEQAIINDE
ncbi:MAG: PfkB family carbohydrate kinase [Verrucomicrobiota bacterium]